MTTLTSNMFEPDGEMNIPELQQDLRRKYRDVGGKIQEIWRNFAPKQREKAMRETVGDGKVLRNSRDPGLEGLSRFLPDWNLEDITSSPDFFLDRLKFRVETDLHHQLFEGVNEGSGDREISYAAAQTINVAQSEEFAVFVNLGNDYGRWMKPNGAEGRRAVEESMAGRSGLIVPSNEAQFLIARQTTTFIFYYNLIEEIVDLDSDSRAKNASSAKRTPKESTKAMANLTLAPQPLKVSIAEVVAQAAEQKSASEAYLDLLRSEPVFLNHAVNMTNTSRPELVPNERGRILPMFADKYVSIAFFEVMCDAVKTIITWEYIVRLVRMLEEDGTLSTCHLEYRRAQSTFRRQMSSPWGVAGKGFRLITTGDTSKIAIKGRPSDYTVSDPQLHCISSLCHPDTNHTDAVQWIQKLDNHNTRYPDDLQRLTEHQVLALGELAIITSFIHTLSTSLAKVAGSKKHGLLFTGRTAELDTESRQYKAAADFGDHLLPTDNLLEPDAARNALNALDEFMLERAGASLGSLCEDLLHDCLNDVEKMYSDAKLRIEKSEKQTQQPYVPPRTEEPKPASFRAEQRREKAKTRPAGETRPYAITAIEPAQLEVADVPVPRLKVKASTASVFDTIFAKAKARGSVAWTDFAGAMADIGFSVTPKYGSVFTFHPPESMGAPQSIIVHRPHASEIEGYKILILSKMLHETYGWTAKTFEVE